MYSSESRNHILHIAQYSKKPQNGRQGLKPHSWYSKGARAPNLNPKSLLKHPSYYHLRRDEIFATKCCQISLTHDPIHTYTHIQPYIHIILYYTRIERSDSVCLGLGGKQMQIGKEKADWGTKRQDLYLLSLQFP